MLFYNTLNKKKEEFVPIVPGKVSIYVCGPTVYDFIHIGNARPMMVFDTLRRYLEHRGYEVNYVSNSRKGYPRRRLPSGISKNAGRTWST